MIQYETMLLTRGKSQKVSTLKKQLLSTGQASCMTMRVDDGKYTMQMAPMKSVTIHGKHDLIFLSAEKSRSLHCRDDTMVLTPEGFKAVKDLQLKDELIFAPRSIDRLRLGKTRKYVELEEVTEFEPLVMPLTIYRDSAIMWIGKRNDVMRVVMHDSDNVITSTGMIIYGGKNV